MTDQSESKTLHRRHFLRSVGGASTLAVAAVAGPLAADAQVQQGGKPDPRRARYKESEHTKAFYRTNRY
jgi:hypothetical protein